MPNIIATEERAKISAAHFKAEFPLSEFLNKEIENSYAGGAGDTVSVKTVDYGKVIDTPDGDMTDVDMSTFSIKTPVQVNFKTNPVELSAKDLELNLSSFSEQIVKPRMSLLASKVTESGADTIARAAGRAIVLNSPGDATFGVLSDAIAYIRQSKVGDKTAGLINYSVESLVTSKGANQFGNHTSLGTSLYEGKIKFFGGIDWLPISELPLVTMPQAIAGARLAAPIYNGAKEIQIAFTGTAFIPKHTPFSIAGVNAVDCYGNDLKVPRVFVVSKDTECSGATAVPVAPVWFAREAAGLKNASSAGAANAEISFPLAAKSYYVNSVFAEKAIAFASLKPAKLEGGIENAVSNIDGINVMMSRQANIVKFKSISRWDVLVGSEPLYQQGACNIYVPIS